ncbi:MAG: DUF6519 domain-containing protein [Thiobacillaceae bacterium]|jgi:hypothetical protein
MKGDFTRDTFDAARHFSRVLMQQGRVQLDADWNEQTSILLHYLRTLAGDLLGPSAGPGDAMGFDLITGGPNADAQIDAIEPDATRAAFLKQKVAGGDAVIGIGRYYVQGMLAENDRALLYTEQAGYPFSEDTKLENLKGKALMAYLDVWERHISYVQDDHIREVALGGPDTCTRAQVVWQLKVLLRPDNAEQFDCSSLEALVARDLPRLRARAKLDKPATGLCVIAPESRYRGAENQLYRVEVQQGGSATGDASGATYKWSRENGSVVFPIVSLTATTVVVENLGRDECLSVKPGDWVEVSDDDIALGEQAGLLAQVDTVDRDALTITLTLPAAVTALPNYAASDVPSKHPLLRRWDHPGDPAAWGGALQIVESGDPAQGWIELEDGVQIWFGQGGQYKAGDYWLIPARVATGDVEWPEELDSNGVPKIDADGNSIQALQLPHGPVHYYAPLWVTPGGDGVQQDCRCTIRPAQQCPWK